MQKTKYIFVTAVLVLALLAPSLAAPRAYARPIGPETPTAFSWLSSTEVGSPKSDQPTRAEAIASDAPVRVIIKLSAPPLVKYQGGINGLAPAGMNAKNTKVEVHSAAAEAYLDYLAQQQAEFAVQLAKVVPSAQIEYNYRLTYNGVAVSLPGSSMPSVEKLAGRHNVFLATRHYPTMDASIPEIGLYDGFFNGTNPGVDMGLWKQLGGHAKAGEGIKVAMLDTGIDQEHKFFDPTGYSYPTDNPYLTYPRGETAYTTKKVIAAHVYLRPSAPVDPAYDCACPQDYIGHGSHTAGTVAGNFNTTTPLVDTPISGVAPRAWLMNYKIFYHNLIDGGEYSETPEELAALEDAVNDDADVISNSWGGSDVNYQGPDVEAFGAAVDAGIVVVFSAGNEGPSANSIGAPGVGEKFITVGASTTNRVYALPVSVTTPTPVPGTLMNMAGVVSSGPTIDTPLAGLYRDSGDTGGNLLGCSAFPTDFFTNTIALIKRGACIFADKVQNAYDAGAIGVVVWNNAAGPAISMSGLEVAPIPAVMVDNNDGANLQAYYYANPGTAALQIETDLARLTKSQWQDVSASFSSKGPNPVNLIKPDLMAPGVNILSSVPYGDGYDIYQGTSMAAPHVSGVAALVLQAHPGWDPQQVKSAIVNTTKLPASLDATCSDVIGAPYPGPMCRGSGRLWAGSFGAGDPGLLLDPVSISLGAQYAPITNTIVIQVPIDVQSVVTYTANGTVSVTPGVGDAHFTITPSTYSFNLAGGASTVLTATFAIAPGIPVTATATGSDYWGQINITFGQSGYYNLHIPYWVRMMPFANPGPAEVLLLDDDGSNVEGLNLGNYQAYYTDALDALNVSYVVLETDWSTCVSPWDVARNYDKVIWFTGDSSGYLYWCDFGILDPNISGLNRLMSSGAKFLVSGQDFGYGLASATGDGRSSDLGLFFGAGYVQDDIFHNTTIPIPSAQAVSEYNPFLENLKIDFSDTATDAAHNQDYVDELSVPNYTDVDALPLFQAAVQADNYYEQLVGTRISSEPTIERVRNNPRTLWTPLGYRNILLSFGLEAVSWNTALAPNYGYLMDRPALIANLLEWLDDNVSIEFFDVSPTTNVDVNEPVEAMAAASSSESCKPNSPSNGSCGIVYFRWDWGDGSTPDFTYCNYAAASGPAGNNSCQVNYHGYAHQGVYLVRVEAMDMYGHKAVSEPLAVYVDTHFNFLPAVLSSQP